MYVWYGHYKYIDETIFLYFFLAYFSLSFNTITLHFHNYPGSFGLAY